MKLKDYRSSINKSVKDAAAELGVSEPCYRYWEAGKKTPSDHNMVEIYQWSSGHVCPNDFYNLPHIKSSPSVYGVSDGACKSAGGLYGFDTPGASLCQSARQGDILQERPRGSAVDVLPGQIDLFADHPKSAGVSP